MNWEWSQPDKIAQLSKRKYGKDFASRVIKKVIETGRMHYNHRDYCGIGIFYDNGKIIFSSVYDSWPVDFKNPIVMFKHEKEAIEFLAEQSDFSMSGADKKSIFKETDLHKLNNQRITKAMMQKFLGGQLK